MTKPRIVFTPDYRADVRHIRYCVRALPCHSLWGPFCRNGGSDATCRCETSADLARNREGLLGFWDGQPIQRQRGDYPVLGAKPHTISFGNRWTCLG